MDDTLDPNRLVSLAEACALVDVSERTLYKWIADGKVESVVTPSGRRRIVARTLFRTSEHRRTSMNWKALISQIALVALSVNPLTAPLAPLVVPAITATEDLFKHKPKPTSQEEKNARNQAKLHNALILVQAGIQTTNQLHPGTIDPAVSDALIKDSISTVVDATNLIHKSPIAALPAAA